MNVPRIAIVEDSEHDVALLRKAFAKIQFDCQLMVFPNGEEAYYQLQLDEPDITEKAVDMFILDLKMPLVSGLEFLKEVKHHNLYKDTPAIMFSASVEDRDIESSYAHHADGYYVKPDNFAELLEVAENIRKVLLEHAKDPS